MKSNEWYTPAKYIEAAREVMGRIDLDPASSSEANLTVKATKYYDKTTNGLMQPWYGCVWLNPPFNKIDGRSTIAKWSKKLLREYGLGSVTQAVLLAAGQTSSRWFLPMWQFPICFTDHHIGFYCPQLGMWKGQRDCTLFVYLGPHEARFIDIFSRFGTVARRVSVPKEQPIMRELWEASLC